MKLKNWDDIVKGHFTDEEILHIKQKAYRDIAGGKRKYPKINPQFVKDNDGKTVSVILKLHEWASIYKEMSDLAVKINKLRKESTILSAVDITQKS